MAASFGWGTLAASPLVIGAIFALRFNISLRAIGLIMGFGAGVLISALSFDLKQQRFRARCRCLANAIMTRTGARSLSHSYDAVELINRRENGHA